MNSAALGADVFDAIGPSRGVEFPARRLRSARVVWINERWYLEHGINVLKPAVRKQVEESLLDKFAVTVPTKFDPPDIFSNASVTLLADRYGGIIGTKHGGSGRCGSLDGMIAKGVGRTPLVNSLTTDWYHSHGCMWLEEAIREAIFSEVVATEFPHSAAPAIAVIDSGIPIYWDKSGNTGERRGVLIRPAMFRFAHLERSIYFGVGGSEQSEQYQDVLRCKGAAAAVLRRCGPNGETGSALLAAGLLAVATQIGFGWAHRIFSGGLYSSNVVSSGAFVDFGGFRSVPSWKKFRPSRGALRFGEELGALNHISKSVQSSLKRYGECELKLDQFSETGSIYAYSAFDEANCAAFGIDRNIHADMANKLSGLFRSIFYEQQYAHSGADDGVLGEDSGDNQAAWPFSKSPLEVKACKVHQQLVQILRETTANDSEYARAIHNAKGGGGRWAYARRSLGRETLSGSIQAALNSSDPNSPAFPSIVSRLIEGSIVAGRRTFDFIPASFIIIGTVALTYCSAIYGYDLSSQCSGVWVNGTVTVDGVAVFGQVLSVDFPSTYYGDCSSHAHLTGLCLRVGRELLQIPPALPGTGIPPLSL